jgi:endonuclease/exonuclease/phosphatase family metal-dependent hydrolase
MGTKMMIQFSVLLIFLLMMNGHSQEIKYDTVKVMTFNIRCGSCEKPEDVNNWKNREYLAAKVIKENNPDLIGLQEAEKFQIDVLINLLENYNWVGAGRDDGKNAGEFTAIFYKKDKFTEEESSTFWLSETPDVPSKDWDAALNRTATYIKLKNKISGNEFYLFNTHFDHIGDTARIESAKLMLNKIENIGEDLPVVLTGDFNTIPDSDPYKIIVNGNENSFHLFDTSQLSQTPHYGGISTFNGFGKTMDMGRTIDYIFVNDKIKVLTHGVITTTYDNHYPSDHYPVISEIVLK